MSNSREFWNFQFRPERRKVLVGTATVALGSLMSRSLLAGSGNSANFDFGSAVIIDALGSLTNPDAQARGMGGQYDERVVNDVRASGLTAINHTLNSGQKTPPGGRPLSPFEGAVRSIAELDTVIRDNSTVLTKVLTGQDIIDAKVDGKTGVIYGFQNCTQLEDDVSRIVMFAQLGVRILQLTYNDRNLLGDGCLVSENAGLTDFGRECVLRMNDAGILVDLGHSGEQTCLDALATSRSPITISHTGCRAILDVPRNKTDDELRLVAEGGGVVGIYFMPMFLDQNAESSADVVIRHIEHAVNICGEDHVGIGTDNSISSVEDMDFYREFFRGVIDARQEAGISAPGEAPDRFLFVDDMRGPEKYRILAERLQLRGFSATRIEKIMGSNFLRLMRDIW